MYERSTANEQLLINTAFDAVYSKIQLTKCEDINMSRSSLVRHSDN